MNRLLLILTAVALPAVCSAQAFKVAKYSIGGDGGTDYVTAEPGTGRVFVSRATHVMVVDGTKGTVTGDIRDSPRNHGSALVTKYNRGSTPNGRDYTEPTVSINRLVPIKKTT